MNLLRLASFWLLLHGTAFLAGAQARIELYTMGPGDDLFSKFGHAALCVVETKLPGGGLCYNYGTADFSRPIALGWDVIRGRAEFWVAVSDRTSMILSFSDDDRTIYRQVLPLGRGKVEWLRRSLAVEATPENRRYVYNHFLDNCSTRPRDLIDRATNGELRQATLPNVRTFRAYANEGLGSFDRRLIMLSDLLLGRWVDEDIDTFAAMFLPRVLRHAVDARLGARPEVVYQRRAPLATADVARARIELSGAVAAVVLVVAVLVLRGSERRFRRARRFAAVLLCFLGTVLIAAAVVSPLPELRRNELVLVLVPFDILLWSTDSALLRLYSGLRLGELALVAVLATAEVFVQPLWPFWFLTAGILGAVAVRSYRASAP